MLSLTYGVPSVSFEAPGDLLASRRLHLPLPPGNDYTSSNITTHVYHTADPIAMGVCNGALSSCAVAGFALESRCHTGRSIVYDTVGKLGWSVDIRTHRINAVIDNLLVQNWVSPKKGEVEGRMGGWGWWPGGGREPEKDPKKPKDDGQQGHGVPDPIAEDDCVDCFRWDFV
jgi:lipase ATG15